MSQAISGDRFEAFLLKPTSQRFRDLQRSILSHPSYDPRSDSLRSLARLFSQKRFSAVLRKAAELQPIWQLSPQFHYLAGLSAMTNGDPSRSAWEKKASRACLNYLLKSGDGTFERPFKVTYLADETDILMAIGADVRHQTLADTDAGFHDVATLHDGTEIWFDVDELVCKQTSHSRPTALKAH